MKSNAINRSKLNWEKTRASALEQAADKQNAYQLGPIFRMLFESLNDFHGAFYYRDSAFRWTRNQPEISDSIKNEYLKGVFIQTDILQDNIGYLRVPAMTITERDELDKKSQGLNDSLCALLDKNVKGIVLDLRLNGGGAMFPMMLGLEQLLHNGKIGSFESKTHENWILRDNNFYLDSINLTTITPKCTIRDKDIPVAVLIGPGTVSSGEFLAISFKKRKNTVFIGSNTAGYVTSTVGFEIGEAVTLLLATGYGRDREGQIYEHPLSPDIYLKEPGSFNDIKNDKIVLAAIKWIETGK
jgi:C-terminal processing protease CtpA/Prc